MTLPLDDRSEPAPSLPPHADPAAWEALVASLDPDAMIVVLGASMSRRLREHCTPEDIWQETLVHAWRDRAQHAWTGTDAYRAWLFEIAQNRIREAARNQNAVRRGGGRPARRFSEIAPSTTTSVSGMLPADSTTPSRVFTRGEKALATEQALRELPPEMEAVVRLYLREELTMEQVAERLGIGVDAAWHRYHRGIDLLSRRLRPWASGTGDGG